MQPKYSGHEFSIQTAIICHYDLAKKSNKFSGIFIVNNHRTYNHRLMNAKISHSAVSQNNYNINNYNITIFCAIFRKLLKTSKMNTQGVEGANNDINVATVLEELFAPQPPLTLSEPEVPEQPQTGVPNLMLTFKPATQDTATATEVQVATTAVPTVESEPRKNRASRCRSLTLR